MHEVFEKARLLGEAIQRSQEFQGMKEAEQAAMADAQAAALMSDFLSHKTEVEDMLSDDAPDPEVLAGHSAAMEALQAQLNDMDIVQSMTRARAEFAGMMQQVNQVLRFLVTGEMEDDEEEGCGGNCGGCSGCGGHHVH